MKRNKQGKFRKSYIPKLLILLTFSLVSAGLYTETITASNTEVYINEVKPVIHKAKQVIKSLSNETDQAVQEAQAKVEKERQQLLSEIADLQAKQEKKVERLKELENLGFTPESS